jgi:hypothetical protein
MKTHSLALTLALCPGLLLSGCNKAAPGAANAAPGASERSASRSGGGGAADPILTKEEVGAVLGQPVTAVEGKGTHLKYKTDTMMLEATIELDRERGEAEAVRSMEGARKATGFLGGKAEEVPGLGDEAIFGAMSTLYVRKGSTFVLIQPPNLQQIAGMKAMQKVQQAPLGSDDQVKAMEALKETQKTDPTNAGLQGGDAMQGALATIKASSQKQGTQYETDARAMAQALATKVLAKL